jgi:DNA-binding IclR family transcriptional regulator
MPTRASAINSVQKSCRILRSLTEPRVSRLSEIAAQAGLNKVTTLRILEVLTREGFVRREEKTKTYSLGNEVFILAAALRDRDDLRVRARPSLVRLAAMSEDSVLLSVRSGGTESVCVDREVGPFPIRANYLDIGSRRPLGIGAGAMALLAWQSQGEIDAILPLVEQRSAAVPQGQHDLAEKRDRALPRTRLLGVPEHARGSHGRGRRADIRRRRQARRGAISIAALSDRLSSRMEQLVDMLKREAEIAHPKRSLERQ